MVINASLAGQVLIGNSLLGSLDVIQSIRRDETVPQANAYVRVGGSLAGQIHVLQSLEDDPNSPVEIEVVGPMGANAAIAVNWNGFELGDENWVPGALVRVNGTDYTGSAPAARIVDITCPKGDMNNSADPRDPNTWFPDFDDIDPFVLALADPAAYDAAYVALAGSRIYHGDADCDDDLDFDDIDPFTARLSGVIPWCETCSYGDGPAGPPAPLDPVAVAEAYRAHLVPERLPVFVQMVRELVRRYHGTPRGEFWAAVLADLE